MTLMQAAAGTLVRDELQAVVSMLCMRFPDRSRAEVEWLVTDVYQDISGNARIRTHLIPLTLNRCRGLLSSEDPRAEATDHVTPAVVRELSHGGVIQNGDLRPSIKDQGLQANRR